MSIFHASRLVFITGLVGLGLPACHPKDTGKPDTSEDTHCVVCFETADTDTDTESAVDTDTGESGETDTDSGETDDTGPAKLASLVLYPSRLAVAPGADFPLRLVATDLDGEIYDVAVEDAVFSSSDLKVADVSAGGLATANSVGEVILSADYMGEVATAEIEVVDAGTIEIQLIDADTHGTVGGLVAIGEGESIETDNLGFVVVETDGSPRLDVSAWNTLYIPTTMMQTAARRLVIPMRSHAADDVVGVDYGGDVDFSSISPGQAGDIKVGLAASLLKPNPLFFEVRDLIGETRTITAFGSEADVPGNIFINGFANDYFGHTSAGAYGIWSMGGPVPVEDLLKGINNAEDVLGILADNLVDFSFGWAGLGNASDGDEISVDIAPDVNLGDAIVVTVPTLPLGFSGDEQILVLVVREVTAGAWAIMGLGLGNEIVTARSAPQAYLQGDGTGSDTDLVLALAQVNGIGSGGAMAFSVAPIRLNAATLPEFKPIPNLEIYTPSTHEYSFTADTDFDLIRMTIDGGRTTVRDVYFSGGDHAGSLPLPDFDFSNGQTTWNMQAFETRGQTFDGFMAEGLLSNEDLSPDLITNTRVVMDF